MQHLGVALLWLMWRLLPVRALGSLGAALGGVMYWLARERRHIADTNLRLCFPEWDKARHARALKAHFRALGRAFMQDTVSWWGSREEVERMTRLEDVEHYGVHAGKPLIWLAPHFVGLNAGGVRLSVEFGTAVTMYSPLKNPLLDRVMLHARTRFGQSKVYPRRAGIKPVIRAIRQGLPFYYLPDMDFGRKDAIFVPFFGVPAATLTALSRLAKATGAVVVPCITRQEGDGYVTRFYPAWDHFPSDDVEADTRRMNAFLEERIREMPEQYYWVHRRFKTRPAGEESLYG